MNNNLRLAQLFASEEDGVTNDDNDLEDKTEPELIVCQRHVLARSTDIPDGDVGEDFARANLVGSCSSVIESVSVQSLWKKATVKDLPSEHDNTRTDELRKRQCHTNVQSREGLQQDHTQANTLDGIKDTEPEPCADTDVRTGAPAPWNVETHAGCTPPHLTPSRTTETNREDGKKPGVNLGVTCDCVLDIPCDDKQPDLRIRIPRRRPQIPTKKMAIMITTAHLGTPA